jgi:predicted enzyme related to lactoylglutathione lyase
VSTREAEVSGIEVLGVDNICFATGDLNQARAFYESQLGLEVKFAFPQASIVGYRLGPEEPGLLIRAQEDLEPSMPRATPRLWLEVADARATAATLADAGIAPLAVPFEINTGWVVEISDPWGNILGFTDYTKDPARGRKASG